MLADRRVKATFFVFVVNPNFDEIVRVLLKHGHELAIHYQGRWGFCKSTSEYVDQAHKLKRRIRSAVGSEFVPRHVRPPGGCICPESAATLKAGSSLSTAIGTAYSFDADLCAATGPALQAKTAALMTYDGAIAIFHDRDRRGDLERTLRFYFEALDEKFGENQWSAVGLHEVVFGAAPPGGHVLPLLAVVRCARMERL